MWKTCKFLIHSGLCLIFFAGYGEPGTRPIPSYYRNPRMTKDVEQTPASDRIYIPPYKFPFYGMPYGLYSNAGWINPGLFPFVPGGPGFPPFDGMFGGMFGLGGFGSNGTIPLGAVGAFPPGFPKPMNSNAASSKSASASDRSTGVKIKKEKLKKGKGDKDISTPNLYKKPVSPSSQQTAKNPMKVKPNLNKKGLGKAKANKNKQFRANNSVETYTRAHG